MKKDKLISVSELSWYAANPVLANKSLTKSQKKALNFGNKAHDKAVTSLGVIWFFLSVFMLVLLPASYYMFF
jgi:hypothetical protein